MKSFSDVITKYFARKPQHEIKIQDGVISLDSLEPNNLWHYLYPKYLYPATRLKGLEYMDNLNKATQTTGASGADKTDPNCPYRLNEESLNDVIVPKEEPNSDTDSCTENEKYIIVQSKCEDIKVPLDPESSAVPVIVQSSSSDFHREERCSSPTPKEQNSNVLLVPKLEPNSSDAEIMRILGEPDIEPSGPKCGTLGVSESLNSPIEPGSSSKTSKKRKTSPQAGSRGMEGQSLESEIFKRFKISLFPQDSDTSSLSGATTDPLHKDPPEKVSPNKDSHQEDIPCKEPPQVTPEENQSSPICISSDEELEILQEFNQMVTERRSSLDDVKSELQSCDPVSGDLDLCNSKPSDLDLENSGSSSSAASPLDDQTVTTTEASKQNNDSPGPTTASVPSIVSTGTGTTINSGPNNVSMGSTIDSGPNIISTGPTANSGPGVGIPVLQFTSPGHFASSVVSQFPIILTPLTISAVQPQPRNAANAAGSTPIMANLFNQTTDQTAGNTAAIGTGSHSSQDASRKRKVAFKNNTVRDLLGVKSERSPSKKIKDYSPSKSLSKEEKARLNLYKSRCGVCSQVFLTAAQLQRHVDRKHKSRTYEPQSEGEKIKNEAEKPKDESAKLKKFKAECGVCGKRCSSAAALQRHIGSYHGSRVCKYCSGKLLYLPPWSHSPSPRHPSLSAFPFEAALQRHIGSYHGSRVCKYCSGEKLSPPLSLSLFPYPPSSHFPSPRHPSLSTFPFPVCLPIPICDSITETYWIISWE